mmetsp:Transcript_10600/g.24567  ORF Transcript_10600/g.24567 Transcript_10600/m.24567 type:complete len:248 (+) Transcript_10600:997-1740(+)
MPCSANGAVAPGRLSVRWSASLRPRPYASSSTSTTRMRACHKSESRGCPPRAIFPIGSLRGGRSRQLILSRLITSQCGTRPWCSRHGRARRPEMTACASGFGTARAACASGCDSHMCGHPAQPTPVLPSHNTRQRRLHQQHPQLGNGKARVKRRDRLQSPVCRSQPRRLHVPLALRRPCFLPHPAALEALGTCRSRACQETPHMRASAVLCGCFLCALSPPLTPASLFALVSTSPPASSLLRGCSLA